jgi:serine/threonine-protein phosphatase CPPED1
MTTARPMKRRTFLASALFGAAAAGVGYCSPIGFEPFTFIRMSDPQLGDRADGKGGDVAFEAGILERAVARINLMRPAPAFVAVCGDLVETPGDPAQIAAYKRIMGAIGSRIPVYNVPGNHDIRSNLSEESIAAYRTAFGPDRFAFDLHDWRFIGLDSPLLQHTKRRPDELDTQTKWLRKTLSRPSRPKIRGTAVFMHHPFSAEEIGGGAGHHSVRRAYLDLFAKHRVTAVFFGHLHLGLPEQSYKGVRLIYSTGLCRAYDGNPGMYVERVGAKSLDSEFVPVADF